MERMRRISVTKKERIEIRYEMNLAKEEALNQERRTRSSSGLLISVREERSLALERMRRILVTKKERIEIGSVMNLEKEEALNQERKTKSSSSLLT